MPLKHPKAKGNRLENEVVKAFKDVGIEAERCWASNGKSRGLPEEVDIVVKKVINFLGKKDCDMFIQCKFVAKLAKKFIPSENIDATVYRQNNGERFIMLRLDDFIKKFLL